MSQNTPGLGKLLVGNEQRDAVHIAIEPMIAAEELEPGQHIGMCPDGRAGWNGGDYLGVVDPLLTRTVKEGQRFYMWVYPDTITSLRHSWTHPVLDEYKTSAKPANMVSEKESFEAALKTDPYDQTTRLVFADWLEEHGETLESEVQRNWTAHRQESIEWLESYAVQVEVSYEKLIDLAKAHLINSGDYHILSFDTPSIVYTEVEEFWRHYEVVTLNKVPEDKKGTTFFSCSC